MGAGLYFSGEYISDWRVGRVSQAAPVRIHSHGLSSEEHKNLELRIDAFTNKRSQWEASRPLQLSVGELTSLAVSAIPEEHSSKIQFECEDDSLFLRGSIALNDWGYEGQYLNGRLWVAIG